MKKQRRYIGLIVCVAVLLALQACSSKPSLQQRQNYAEKQTAALRDVLEHTTSMDSVRAIAEKDDDLFFYIFDPYQMVYWSSNRLVAESDQVFLTSYDTWQNLHFGNAETTARWTRAGYYNILTVIPTAYTEIENNPDIDSIASKTFSFREVIETPHSHSVLRANPYYYIIIALFVLVGVIGIIGVVRHRGFRNMRLATRILYIILGSVLGVFIYFFVISVRYVETNFEQRQRRGLQMRSEYIQAYLRSKYSLHMDELTPSVASDLAVELRDLGYDMNQDIHVYSLSGDLLASSSPALFTGNILYHRMPPEALYSETFPVLRYETIGSHSYLVTYLPFYNDYFNTIGYISVPYFLSEQKRNAEVDAMLARLLPPYLVVLILSLIISFFAARTMTAPMSMLADKMRRFQIGGKDNHIDYSYRDELGALVERYNMLVDQVEESAAHLARAEREGAWRTMARQIAHEINNPLTPMKLTVQKLQRLRGTEQFDAYFEKATPMLISEIDNLAHIAQSFSTFAKQPEVTTDEVDIAAKLSQVITLQRANDEQIPIRYIGADSGITVLADPEQVGQVFVNILRNAIQASPKDIIVTLNAAYSDKEVQISISDDGCGIPESVQAKIFQPNFTTKSNGNGLGLAISKHIVEGTDGRITFESSPKGTTFFIYFRKK